MKYILFDAHKCSRSLPCELLFSDSLDASCALRSGKFIFCFSFLGHATQTTPIVFVTPLLIVRRDSCEFSALDQYMQMNIHHEVTTRRGEVSTASDVVGLASSGDDLHLLPRDSSSRAASS